MSMNGDPDFARLIRGSHVPPNPQQPGNYVRLQTGRDETTGEPVFQNFPADVAIVLIALDLLTAVKQMLGIMVAAESTDANP